MNNIIFIIISAILLVACGGEKSTDRPARLGGIATDQVVPASTNEPIYLSYPRSFYKINQIGSEYYILESSNSGREIKIVGTTVVHFSDLSISFNSSDSAAGQAYRLYRAAFKREPDPAGLGYWISALEKHTLLIDVSNSFMKSAEFKSLYGIDLSNTAFVRQLYLNVLGREPDQAGLEYWVSVLDKKLATPEFVLTGFSESPENKAATASIMAEGISFQKTAPEATEYPRAQVDSFYCNSPVVHEFNDLHCFVKGKYLVRPRTPSVSPPIAQVILHTVELFDPHRTICYVVLPQDFERDDFLEFRCTIRTSNHLQVKLLDPYFITWEPIYWAGYEESGNKIPVQAVVTPVRNPKRKVTGLDCHTSIGGIIKGDSDFVCVMSGEYLDDSYTLAGVSSYGGPVDDDKRYPTKTFDSQKKTFQGNLTHGNCSHSTGIEDGVSYYIDQSCVLHTDAVIYDSIDDLNHRAQPKFKTKIN